LDLDLDRPSLARDASSTRPFGRSTSNGGEARFSFGAGGAFKRVLLASNGKPIRSMRAC
jgi:hypothetical protein